MSDCLKFSLCELFVGGLHAKNRQRAMPAWTYETTSRGWRRTKDVGTLRYRAEETSRKLSLRLGLKESHSQERDLAREMEDDDQRWPSILGSCLGFLLSSCNCHTYTQSDKKWHRLCHVMLHCLKSVFCLFLLHLTVFCWFLSFCSTCEVPTLQGGRRNNGVLTRQKDQWPTSLAYRIFHTTQKLEKIKVMLNPVWRQIKIKRSLDEQPFKSVWELVHLNIIIKQGVYFSHVWRRGGLALDPS